MFCFQPLRCALPARFQEQAFPCGEVLLVAVLLQDDKVAAYLDAAGLHEKRVGQAQGGDDMGVMHQIVTHKAIGWAVSHAP